MKYWAMLGDDEGCYGLIDEFGMGHGFVLLLEPDVWRWRTEAGYGTATTRDDAMDAAEDSLEGKDRRR